MMGEPSRRINPNLLPFLCSLFLRISEWAGVSEEKSVRSVADPIHFLMMAAMRLNHALKKTIARKGEGFRRFQKAFVAVVREKVMNPKVDQTVSGDAQADPEQKILLVARAIENERNRRECKSEAKEIVFLPSRVRVWHVMRLMNPPERTVKKHAMEPLRSEFHRNKAKNQATAHRKCGVKRVGRRKPPKLVESGYVHSLSIGF
jgi:hypothetical protein